MNPWLVHLKAFRAEHPELSYKECMVEARQTYVPIPKGGNPLALAALATVPAVTGTVDKITDAVQYNKSQNKQYQKAALDKKINEIKKIQRLVKNGRMPYMTDKQIFDYVERNFS